MDVKNLIIGVLSLALVLSISLGVYFSVRNDEEYDDDQLTTVSPDVGPTTTTDPNFDNDDDDNTSKCGYNTCSIPHPTKLNVHIIAHTHDDAGWKKPIDQYYTERIEYILNSVIIELNRDPSRKFIYVEMAFFTRWWSEQTEKTKEITKNLVKNGQLQFTLGAWTMPDEGASTYKDLITNAELGMEFLSEVFGFCGRPLVGWQIDPFGHSTAVRKIYKNLGFDALFLGRLSIEEYYERAENRQLEFIWVDEDQDQDKNEGEIFTYFLPRTGSEAGYDAPKDFKWDARYNFRRITSQFIQDDKSLDDYNVNEKVQEFRDLVFENFEGKYTTNNFIVPFGGDFWWRNANQVFENIEKLMKYSEEIYGEEMKIFYSTPACYYKAVREAHENQESLKTQGATVYPLTKTPTSKDFFPYNQMYSTNMTIEKSKNSYWTGYYSSRPQLKRNLREKSILLDICQHLEMSTNLNKNSTYLHRTVGLMQHHDAVTGTAKEHVVTDYNRRLDESVLDCFDGNKEPNVVYNPLPIIRSGVPGLGWKPLPLANTDTEACSLGSDSESSPSISNKNFKLSLTDLKSSAFLVNDCLRNTTFSFSYDFLFYNSHPGSEIKTENGLSQASGAYVFRPREQKAFDTVKRDRDRKFFNDEEGNFITIEGSDYVKQKWRVEGDFIVLDYEVGPLPKERGREFIQRVGKEVIFRIDFDLGNETENETTWLTDTNSYGFISRNRSDFTDAQPISSRYYPATSESIILTKNHKYSLLFDRSAGTTSLKNNQLEIMIHRRTLKDDGMGLNQKMNDTSVVRGRISVSKQKRDSTSGNSLEQLLDVWNNKNFMSPLVETFIDENSDLHVVGISEMTNPRQLDWACQDGKDGHKCTFLKKPLPDFLNVLTLRRVSKDVGLVRLENLSNTDTTINSICDYFYFKEVASIATTTLDGAFNYQSINDNGCEGFLQIKKFSILTVRINFT